MSDIFKHRNFPPDLSSIRNTEYINCLPSILFRAPTSHLSCYRSFWEADQSSPGKGFGYSHCIRQTQVSAPTADVHESSYKPKQQWFSQTPSTLKVSLAQFRPLLQITVRLVVPLTLIAFQPLNMLLAFEHQPCPLGLHEQNHSMGNWKCQCVLNLVTARVYYINE